MHTNGCYLPGRIEGGKVKSKGRSRGSSSRDGWV